MPALYEAPCVILKLWKRIFHKDCFRELTVLFSLRAELLQLAKEKYTSMGNANYSSHQEQSTYFIIRTLELMALTWQLNALLLSPRPSRCHQVPAF